MAATKMSSRLSVVFVHPDLGIGGAERLVVDAGIALKQNGHRVSFVTAHHDTEHCFTETKDGQLDVFVCGDWLPRSLFGRCMAVCAYVRMCVAALYLCVCWSSDAVDVVFCDQISVCLPLLRLLKPRTKLIFYCHFPDQLLTQRETNLKKAYRYPLDWLEEWSTGFAHCILVNSKYTASVFRRTFPSLAGVNVIVLYPSLNLDVFDQKSSDIDEKLSSSFAPERTKHLLLSLNRYERKKNIALALRALADLHGRISSSLWAGVHLVIAGGYDARVTENVDHFGELKRLTDQLNIKDKVTFLQSPNDDTKRMLLKTASIVLYTPSGEHFGIVPLEAMYSGTPVVAVDDGAGPTETIQHSITGLLSDATPDAFSNAIRQLIELPVSSLEEMGLCARSRVRQHFGFDAFRRELDRVILAAIERKTVKKVN